MKEAKSKANFIEVELVVTRADGTIGDKRVVRKYLNPFKQAVWNLIQKIKPLS